MRSFEDVERTLREELERRRRVFKAANKRFLALVAETPSGIPQPDGNLRISQASRANQESMYAFAQALDEFSDFVVRRVIPERLREPEPPE